MRNVLHLRERSWLECFQQQTLKLYCCTPAITSCDSRCGLSFHAVGMRYYAGNMLMQGQMQLLMQACSHRYCDASVKFRATMATIATGDRCALALVHARMSHTSSKRCLLLVEVMPCTRHTCTHHKARCQNMHCYRQDCCCLVSRLGWVLQVVVFAQLCHSTQRDIHKQDWSELQARLV